MTVPNLIARAVRVGHGETRRTVFMTNSPEKYLRNAREMVAAGFGTIGAFTALRLSADSTPVASRCTAATWRHP
jgi:hypothetical protein